MHDIPLPDVISILYSYYYSHWDDGVYPDIADDDDHQGQEEDLRSDQRVIHTVPGVRGHPQQCKLRHAGPILESDISFLR